MANNIEELKAELIKSLESQVGEKVSTLRFRFLAVLENKSVYMGDVDMEVDDYEGKVRFSLQGQFL